MGISADLKIVSQYNFIRKVSFNPTLSVLAMRRSSEIDCAGYVDVGYPFFGNNFATG